MNTIRRQLRSMLRVEAVEGGFTAVFDVGADLAIFPDHFRGSPILPGVCMVQAVLLAAAEARNEPELKMSVLKNAKMTRPVRPGDQVRINGQFTPGPDGDLAIKATIVTADGGHRCADISLIARRASVPATLAQHSAPSTQHSGGST
jgi:3-hydroxymyristoyl/3-hydroxydecanoyl-(acyl carrier protein) dehydratase